MVVLNSGSKAIKVIRRQKPLPYSKLTILTNNSLSTLQIHSFKIPQGHLALALILIQSETT